MFLETSSISGHGVVVAFLVSKSCWTLCDPMDCSPQAPPSRGFSRQEHWSGFHSISLLQGIFPTQRLNLSLLHGQEDSLPLAMVEAQQISDLRISKRTKQQPNCDGRGMRRGGAGRGWGGGGEGYQMFPQEAPHCRSWRIATSTFRITSPVSSLAEQGI